MKARVRYDDKIEIAMTVGEAKKIEEMIDSARSGAGWIMPEGFALKFADLLTNNRLAAMAQMRARSKARETK